MKQENGMTMSSSEREAGRLLKASHGSLEAAMMLYYDQKTATFITDKHKTNDTTI